MFNLFLIEWGIKAYRLGNVMVMIMIMVSSVCTWT